MADPRQHYVWRHYIDAWSNDKGQVRFLRPGQEPRMANPAKIMVEKGFYRLHRLDKRDLELLEIYIEHTGSPDLREHHRQLAGMYTFAVNRNERVQKSNVATPNERKKVHDLVVEGEDMLHSYIERRAVPILDELRHKRKGFINNIDSAVVFFNFLAQQYLRTRNIRESIREYFSQLSPSHSYGNLANIVCYISAVNLGSNLVSERKDFDIVFLESNEGQYFVTGDQPVINLMANRHGGDTTEIIFFYPLSPNLSCMVTPKTYNLLSKQVSQEIVEKLNGFIALSSKYFIVGNSDNVIQLASERQRSPNQSVGVILDYLAKDV